MFAHYSYNMEKKIHRPDTLFDSTTDFLIY